MQQKEKTQKDRQSRRVKKDKELLGEDEFKRYKAFQRKRQRKLKSNKDADTSELDNELSIIKKKLLDLRGTDERQYL